MPITSSAKKALRVAHRRRVFNRRRLNTMREEVKSFKKTPTLELLPSAYQAIDKAKKRGVIKANTAARRKSQLAKLLVVKKA